MKAGTPLTIRRMCALTRVSRAGFYRRGVISEAASVELRDQVQRVALEWPTYGSRRITAELRRGGLSVNRKRVQRRMREDNLLGLRKRKFVTTTDSAQGLPVYPNLAAALVVSGINQLWRADITYIRLLEEFVYLAVVLDAFSRRAIGWALDATLEAKLAVAALDIQSPEIRTVALLAAFALEDTELLQFLGGGVEGSLAQLRPVHQTSGGVEARSRLHIDSRCESHE